MIQALSLSKRFGETLAVRDATFEVSRGEIVGFLGPNGAGKTTTLRMLTAFLPPSSGGARVSGFDVVRDSREVRRRIGYLPENNPLYGEMRVEEYLRYRARLRGVRRGALPGRVEAVVERCRLGEVRGRVIDRLSKGFRQRVGLADALVHEPPILILDEPTIGLDPHQTRQVRGLIRELAHDHTVLLSSHILSEVEQVCHRMIIITDGRVVTSGTAESLRRALAAAPEIRVEGRASREEMAAALADLGEVRSVEDRGPGLAAVTLVAGEDLREEVFRRAVQRGWILRELSMKVPSLEEIFLRLTEHGESQASSEEPRAIGSEGEERP
jgi:ABC-2 type transport system ATP-binding protein